MMPQDVSTQWNSMYDMLNSAMTYQEVLDVITGDWEMKLRQYEMDVNEWEIACQLCQVLKVSFHTLFDSFTHSVQIFKDATLFLSHDSIPNIATIIPAMGCIDEVLATNALDT